jgi:DNA-directed RNA polymerase specialized sigma24 family protein
LFDEVFERWLNEGRASELMNWAFCLCGDVGEDLVQQAYQNFWGTNRGKSSPFRDLDHLSRTLKVAIRNLFIDRLRVIGPKDGHHHDYSMQAREEDSGSEGLERKEFADIVIGCIDRLKLEPEVIIACFLGYDVPLVMDLVEKAAASLEPPRSSNEVRGWMSLRDVAEALGIPHGTLRSWKSRAFHQLQQELEDLQMPFESWDFFRLRGRATTA